uniref:Uncharacterized protein n=1 Tax=Romanomermis culicivorax TaxID=13658 RepID=A0A915HTI0_ROMCU
MKRERYYMKTSMTNESQLEQTKSIKMLDTWEKTYKDCERLITTYDFYSCTAKRVPKNKMAPIPA